MKGKEREKIMEKIYKMLKSVGAANVAIGILIIAAGVTLGVLNIINGSTLLRNRKDILF